MTNHNPSSRGDYDLRADYTKKVSDKMSAISETVLTPTPSATTKTLEEIIDWSAHAATGAFIEQCITGKDKKVVVTEEFLKKHRDEALAAINNLINQRVIEELEKLVSKYAGDRKDWFKIFVDREYIEKRKAELKGGIDEC